MSEIPEAKLNELPDVPRHNLAPFLQDYPLYRTFEFDEDSVCVEYPAEILAFCNRCKLRTSWRVAEGLPTIGSGRNALNYSVKPGYWQLAYFCKNCSGMATSERIRFCLYVFRDAMMVRVLKIGQHPQIDVSIDPGLASVMSTEDAQFYKRGVTLRANNYGIGAVAYLRRVVENQVHYLLNLIAEAAAREGATDAVTRAAAVRESHNFTEKVDLAAELLPQSLRRGGHNPVKLLHDLASAGLHSESDSECTDTFDKCRAAFEYVIRRLESDKAEDEGLSLALKKLTAQRKKN